MAAEADEAQVDVWRTTVPWSQFFHGELVEVERLLEAGASPDAGVGQHGAAPALMQAAKKGHTHVLEALLRAGASAEDPSRIINTVSVNGLTPPGMDTFSYSSSKAAVHMLTRHLGKELASDHITVNAIAPGPFDSNMMAFALNDPNSRAAIASGVPMGRIGMPDDMAGVAIYLASAAGAYVTGAVVPVGGGLSTITE